jgi:tetratricopeptide (TPR) repeat protein/polyferredoxin
MYTLELGQVNAGFLFLLVALVATLVLGRFVCGWGCHIVALQDLCGWLMKKAGIRPRPFRSRLLGWLPVAVALYMFAWPTIKREGLRLAAREGWIEGPGPAPFPGFSSHLLTDAFWATFPGPLFAVLTFATCGFAAVYLLGAKGFCTYGCPYGALFGAADRLAPGRIVVSDACEQCGHCTATCTSNVLVHEEVRIYGQVVDPGCMKCMDCVSVCPKGALSFGFARPSLFRRVRTGADGARSRRYALGLPSEIALAAIGVGATLAYRGLYDGPPLLMSVGLGGITAFVALELWRMLREPTVRIQNLTLRAGGRATAAGRTFSALAAAWLVFTAHSGFVQWERARGRQSLEQTEATRAEALAGDLARYAGSPRHRQAVAAAHAHFTRAERFGLVRVPEIELGLAWTHLLRGELAPAEARLRGAVALLPQAAEVHDHLIDFLRARGRTDDAIAALEHKLGAAPETAADHFRLAGDLVTTGRVEPAVAHYRRAAELAPQSAETHYNLGGLLRRLGRHEDAVTELSIAARLAPNDADTRVELGLGLAALGRNAEAVASLRRAIELAPDRPESRLHLPLLIRELEEPVAH